MTVELPEPPAAPANLGMETPLAGIPETLRRLWADNKALTKASLINFVVYSETGNDLAANTALIHAVTHHHACRALLFSAQPSDEPVTARAWVTAHCQVSGGGKSICSEQITFVLQGTLRDALRNAVFAHLESDLPLVFYWQGDLSERWELHLFRHIDRLVVDSTTWKDPRATLRRLREAWRDSASHFVVLDVAWMRIFPFRQALSGAFDVEIACQRLSHLNRVEITHAPGHRVSAALLASWIAYKAGWSLDQSERVFREADGPPLSRLVLAGSGACRVEIVHAPGSTFLHTTLHAGDYTTSQLTPAAPEDPARLVSERLSRGGNAPLYFKLWKQAEAWL